MRQAGGIIQDLRFAHPAGLFVGIAFGIDVLEGGGHGFTHGQGGLALGGDQDQLAGLAFGFELGQLVDVGVEVGQGAAEEVIGHGILLMKMRGFLCQRAI